VASQIRILHCLRAPIGGLFRHVFDLAKGQAELGFEVGIVCDSEPASKDVARALGSLADSCTLGVTRVRMSRQIGLGDLRTHHAVTRLASKLGVDVLHGHGAKGGVYARLARRALRARGKDVCAFYTPRGGSLHYSRSMVMGRFYIATERMLMPYTDGLIFESRFTAGRYLDLVGEPDCAARIIPNGLYRHEFYEPILTDDASDFVFIGELRKLKGVDILLQALGVNRTVYPAKATIVGSGPDEKKLKRLTRRLRLGPKVMFSGPQTACTAFARGRCVVVPSRSESFPYVVLEAAAAKMPIIATDIGGIPEIVAGANMPLVAPDDTEALAAQMRSFLATPAQYLDRAARLQEIVAERFTVETMTMKTIEFYVSELEVHQLAEAAPSATAP
jgi:glycosyltransferase involved in cell wall biosynthesis